MDTGLAGIDIRYGYGIASHVQRDILAITRFPPGSQLQSDLQQLYTHAMHRTSLMVICMSVFGFIAACLIGPVRLRRRGPTLEHSKEEEDPPLGKTQQSALSVKLATAAVVGKEAVTEEVNAKK